MGEEGEPKDGSLVKEDLKKLRKVLLVILL